MADTQAIRSRVDCRHLAEHLGVVVTRRTGSDWQARCFHPGAHKHGDKNPSLTIGREGFRCWASSCGAKGDCFDLVKELRGVDFKGALAWLTDWAGVKVGASKPYTPPAPPEPDPSPQVRVDTMAKLWALLEPLELTDSATRWLEGRGIDPGVAHALGCRDWHPVLGRIQFMLKGLDNDTKQAVGVYNDAGKPWWPLAASIEGKAAAGGLGVPVFARTEQVPMGWRWRLYKPMRSGAKTLAQPGGGPAPLLGLQVPGDLPAVGKSRVLVVCEGEPDWLSVYDASEGQVAVLGLCAMATGWREPWTEHLEGVRWVVVMAHDDDGGGQKLYDGLYASTARRWGKDWADSRLVRWLVDGSDDCNDKHKRGELAGLLEGLLANLDKREG